MNRSDILTTAKNLTEGDRNDSYGDPYTNLSHAADLWNAYLGTRGIKARDVANMMVLVKLGRAKCGALGHFDNYIDAAAYAAIAGECESRHMSHLTEQPAESEG